MATMKSMSSTVLLLILGLVAGCSAMGASAPSSDGGDGGNVEEPPPRALQLVSLTPDTDPIPVAPTSMKRPIGFTVVVRLAVREDGSTQRIALATLSRGGQVLAELAPKAPNVFQGEIPDRTVLFDASLRTNGSDDPRLPVTLTFVDDRSEKITFESTVGVECAVGPATNHSYFCNGYCGGLSQVPYLVTNGSCGGCGLACQYTKPSGASSYGSCTMYHAAVNGGWVDSCGTFVYTLLDQGALDLNRSCDQICATYKGRSKPGVCVARCNAASNGRAGNYSTDTASYGGVEGIIAARYTDRPDRGIVLACDKVPSAHLAALPESERPSAVRDFGCCCSFD